MRGRVPLGLLALAFFLASCAGGSVGGVQVGFRVDGRTVDFGRVLEGEKVVRSVEVVSTGRADLTVALEATPPFSVQPELFLPAGGQAAVEVTFTAGAERAEGSLTLSSNGRAVVVPLVGVGVRPLSCRPSASCRHARFDLASNRCVETVAQDGEACIPASECLERGVCRSGVCVGSPRSCDDGNVCTNDSCALGIGCVHTPVKCPAPTRSCRVAVCRPEKGCTDAPAPDGEVCGSVDCVFAHLCSGGECKPVPTPEGFPCAPPTPCQGAGSCLGQQCVRPDAGRMQPLYSIPLPGEPRDSDEAPALLASSGNVFFELCGVDGGQDGGRDGGCELRSYTGNGLERFVTPHADIAERRVLAVHDGGVVVLADGALEVYGADNGAPVWSAPATSWPGGVAVSASGELWAVVQSDGGYRVARFGPDGGAWLAPVSGELLALDESATPFVRSADGGSSWAVADGRGLWGGRYLFDLDGGTLVAQLDAGELSPHVLLGRTRGYVLHKRCTTPAPACLEAEKELLLDAFELSDGRAAWQATVLPAVESRLEEAALASAGGLPGVLTLTEALLLTGWESHLQLFTQAGRAYLCPLPPGGRLGGAVFERSALYVFVQRNGAWHLEAYSLEGLPVESSGWPQRHGVSGMRRELP